MSYSVTTSENSGSTQITQTATLGLRLRNGGKVLIECIPGTA